MSAERTTAPEDRQTHASLQRGRAPVSAETIVNDSIQRMVNASTGPRSRERGGKPSPTWVRSAIQMLQRGRAHVSAEGNASVKTMAAELASTGPRSLERGGPSNRRLFYGRSNLASTGPRSLERGGPSNRRLFYGRSNLASTGPRSRERGGSCRTGSGQRANRLQRGRAQSSAEGGPESHRADAGGVASTGPRSLERGGWLGLV